MNNVIFGYTPDEISDLGYQKLMLRRLVLFSGILSD